MFNPKNETQMKRLILIFGMALAMISTMSLSTNNLFAEACSVEFQNQKVEEISADDLPGAVVDGWNDYKTEGDAVGTVYKITNADGSVYYKIGYTDASGNAQEVEFDADGNQIS